ncbi:hypothetical protein F6Y02_01775 [Bacillus megaterium]|nr:hypothetical protein [Priestia megaterium]
MLQKEFKHFVKRKKTFCSGSADSDYLIVSSIFEETEIPLIAVIPTNRQGIEVNGDWDHFGQRQTDSGSITFKMCLFTKKIF